MTEPRVSAEVERKLSVPASFSIADLNGHLSHIGPLSPRKTRRLTAVYYDTDEFHLARARITLRRRTGGDDSGWHLKLPADDDAELPPDALSRDEVTLPLTSGRPGRVPSALANFLIGLVGDAEIKPQATQQTVREPLVVQSSDESDGVEIVDDLVTVTDGAQAGLEYRELEVEVVDAPELLQPVVDALAEAGATPSASKSKGIRALVGDQHLAPVIEIGERPRPKDPAGYAVAFHLRSQVAAIVHQDLRVRRHGPDAVHQFRVAARRLRSVLKAFAPLVDDEWRRHVCDELDWIQSLLGESRDREVLEQRLVDAARSLPAEVDAAAALTTIQRHLDAQLVEANASIEAAMTSRRYRTLVAELHQAVRQLPTTALADERASVVLPPLVSASWKKLQRRAKKLHNEMEGHDDHWHKTRITAKKARYTVEACVPVFGKPAKKFAKQLERVTEMLGEHQDAAVAATLVQQLALSTRGPRTVFALGVVYGQQRDRVSDIRSSFVEVWPHVGHPHWRKWIAST
jgi:CHAD domain-containing protein